MFINLKSQGIQTVTSQVLKCNDCSCGRNTKHRVPGKGAAKHVMIVSDYPGMTEEKQGMPMRGETGRLFSSMLMEALAPYDFWDADPTADGLMKNFYITNVLKCVPRKFEIDKVKITNPKPTDLKACTKHLVSELSIIKPKIILASGTYAVQVLTGQSISNYKKIRLNKYPCLFNQSVSVCCTINAAAIFHKISEGNLTNEQDLLKEDLNYFVDQMYQLKIIKENSSYVHKDDFPF